MTSTRGLTAILGAVLAIGLWVPVSGQDLTTDLAIFLRCFRSGGCSWVGPVVSTGSYLAFAAGTSYTGSVSTDYDGMLVQEGQGILAQRGPTNAEFRWYASKTDSDNYTRVRLTTATAGSYNTLTSQTTTSGSNATSSGLCLQTNNNTTNRWCLGAASGNAGALMQGATPNIIYAITTPTISATFGTGDTIAGKASSFALTVGTSPDTSATVAFATTFTNIPSCHATNTITANLVQAVPTTTAVVLNGIVVAGDIVRVVCVGY